MQVKYVGPYAAVEVPTLGLVATKGEPVEVSDDDGTALLEQSSNWRTYTPPKKKEA